MKHTILTLTFLIGLITFSYAQNETTKVGFGCSTSEVPTELVGKIENLIIQDKLQDISAMLASENSSEKYMAAVSLEKLSKKGHYHLTKEDSLNIIEIHISNKMVPTCSGCTKADELPISKLIKKNYAHTWLHEVIRKYEISGTYVHTVMDNFASGHHEIKLEILSDGKFKDRNGVGIWEMGKEHLVLKYDHLPIDDASGHEKYVISKATSGKTTLTLDEKYSNVQYERVSH